QSADRRVGAHAGAVGALPAQTLLLERRALGLRADVLSRGRAVRLAEGVTSGNQRERLLVVHRHPAEGFADVASRLQRIGLSVRSLWVDIDQAHLDGAERPLQLAVAAVPLVAEPGVFGAPENL